MRTAYLLCLAGVVSAALMAGISASRGVWDAFWPWLALAVSNVGHAFGVLAEMRRQRRRQHAEVALRAVFCGPHGAHSHERQERAEALRGLRS